MEDKNNLYKYPMALTQQFKHCGNPFRIDVYKGCDFGCNYCFANCRGGNLEKGFKIADFSIIEKNFKKAFEDDKETKNITMHVITLIIFFLCYIVLINIKSAIIL